MKMKNKLRQARRTRSPLQRLAQEQRAQELAAERRSWGRPSAGWAGPRKNMKMDDQPENYNYERYCARRGSMSPKKSGKKKARGKKTAPKSHFSRSPIPAAGEPDRPTTTTEFKQTAACGWMYRDRTL